MLLFSTESVKTLGIVFLSVISMCKANIQTAEAKGVGGTVVATSYLTLHSYSKIKCVQKCFDEKRQNRCKIAGYHKASKLCYLSNDTQLIGTADEAFSVFFLGMLSYELFYDIAEIHNYLKRVL